MRISCSDFLAEIGNYLEGDVADEMRAHLESHLATCRTCSILVDSSRKTVQVLVDSECFELPAGTLAPVARKIMDEIRRKS